MNSREVVSIGDLMSPRAMLGLGNLITDAGDLLSTAVYGPTAQQTASEDQATSAEIVQAGQLAAAAPGLPAQTAVALAQQYDAQQSGDAGAAPAPTPGSPLPKLPGVPSSGGGSSVAAAKTAAASGSSGARILGLGIAAGLVWYVAKVRHWW